MAMAAMVAGCSQEEFAPVGEKPSVDLGNRPTIGNDGCANTYGDCRW